MLARARAAKQVEEDGAREVLRAAARWASMHSEQSLVGPAESWHESSLPLGGEGFPYCNRPAGKCDHDHRVTHADDGPTCSCNITPCCRGHHRAKTTGGWSYITVEPGVYLWRSPLGYQFLRDHHGTIDVTPDAERRRLARTFLAHFGEQPGPDDAEP